MERFEQIVNRINMLRGMGLSLAEIHDMIVCADVSEETFFFAYKAAEILEK